MFGINSINGSVQWLGVPDFLRTNGPVWTANLLAPHPSWVDKGSRTNLSWVSQSGGHSDSFFIPWDRPVRVLPVYHRRIFENLCAAARCVCDDLLRDNCLTLMQSLTTCRNPICNPWGRRDEDWDNIWNESVDQ